MTGVQTNDAEHSEEGAALVARAGQAGAQPGAGRAAGLAIDDDRLSVVVVEGGPSLRVVDVAEADLEVGVLRGGRVLDGARLSRRLGDLWQALGLGGVPVALGIQPADAIVDVVTLSAPAGAQLLAPELRHALSQVRGFYGEAEGADPAWAWHPITGARRPAACLAVARRDDVVGVVDAARRSGLLVEAVVPAASAVGRSMPPSAARRGVAVVPWAGGQLLVVVVDGQVVAAPWVPASAESTALVGWYPLPSRVLDSLVGRPDGAGARVVTAVQARQPETLPVVAPGAGLGADSPAVPAGALVPLGLALSLLDGRSAPLDWRRSVLVAPLGAAGRRAAAGVLAGVGAASAAVVAGEAIDRGGESEPVEALDRGVQQPVGEGVSAGAGTAAAGLGAAAAGVGVAAATGAVAGGLGAARRVPSTGPEAPAVGATPVPRSVAVTLEAAIAADRFGEPSIGARRGVGGPDAPAATAGPAARNQLRIRRVAVAVVATAVAAGTFLVTRAATQDDTPATPDAGETRPESTTSAPPGASGGPLGPSSPSTVTPGSTPGVTAPPAASTITTSPSSAVAPPPAQATTQPTTTSPANRPSAGATASTTAPGSGGPATATTTATTAVVVPVRPAAQGGAPQAALQPHGATFSGGKLYLSGAVPDRAMADSLRARAAAVVGAQNIVGDYVVDPAAQRDSEGRVRVDERVLFAKNSAALDPGYGPVIDLAARAMTLNPKVTLIVEGHTDSSGPLEFNLVLSQQRAESIVEALVARGIDRSRLTAVGKGPYEPAVPNDTEEQRQLNRRIEVTFVNLLS